MGEAAALGAQIECIPQWESIFGGGCMILRRRPGSRGLLRASPSLAPSSPLAGQPRPQAAPWPLRAPPRASLLVQLRISAPPWAPWAPLEQSWISRYLPLEVCS